MIRAFLFLFLFACAHNPAKDQKIMPFGIYQHQVSLQVKGQDYEFKGVNRWSSDELIVAMLGPFDMTVLKYHENFLNDEQTIFVDQKFVPVAEEKLLKYFSYLKKIYDLDRSICENKKCVYQRFGKKITFHLDEKNEVSSIESSQKEFKMKIKVVKYEKIP